MTLDYSSLYLQVKNIGKNVLAYHNTLQEKRELANNLLNQHAHDLEELRRKVERAVQRIPSLRCALPLREPLNGHYPSSEVKPGCLLLAADGSQITPDRHAALNFFLVNVGVLQLSLSSSEAPHIITRSDLFFGEDLYTPQGLISSEAVMQERDIQERQVLADLAIQIRNGAEQPNYLLTLMDGALELWGAKEKSEQGSEKFHDLLEKYRQVLLDLRKCEAITAAYVDKPRANLVTDLLEVVMIPENQLDQLEKTNSNSYGAMNKLQGITDEDLFENLLDVGERSAVFAMRSQSLGDYLDDLALHFFYLNVSDRGANPHLARVEIPAWVANSNDMIDCLQAVLIQQCRTLGSTPYPYLLHRAHEAAVVSFQEKEQITQMLIHELLDQGVPIGKESYKQRAKNLGGRQRF